MRLRLHTQAMNYLLYWYAALTPGPQPYLSTPTSAPVNVLMMSGTAHVAQAGTLSLLTLILGTWASARSAILNKLVDWDTMQCLGGHDGTVAEQEASVR